MNNLDSCFSVCEFFSKTTDYTMDLLNRLQRSDTHAYKSTVTSIIIEN